MHLKYIDIRLAILYKAAANLLYILRRMGEHDAKKNVLFCNNKRKEITEKVYVLSCWRNTPTYKYSRYTQHQPKYARARNTYRPLYIREKETSVARDYI